MKYLVEFRGGRLVQVFAGCRQTAIRRALKYTGLSRGHVSGCFLF
jgi:hypothetical protein